MMPVCSPLCGPLKPVPTTHKSFEDVPSRSLIAYPSGTKETIGMVCHALPSQCNVVASDWPFVRKVVSTHTSDAEKTLRAGKPNVPVSGRAGRESQPPLFRCSTYGRPWGRLGKLLP